MAERIETENTVVDLLDYDVRFGQGFLFAPPRPVRAEALQGANGHAAKEPAKADAAAPLSPAAPAEATGPAGAGAKIDAKLDAKIDTKTDARSMLARLVRASGPG